MIKNSFISVISQKEKEENWGSVEFQVFCFTNKIRRTYFLFGIAQIDYLSQRGLRKILGKHQRLLAYLSKKKLSTLQRINWSVEYLRHNNSLI